jgi:hypothetical protein
MVAGMSTNTTRENERDAVVIVGGKGGLEARYRETIEGYGYALWYFETRVPPRHVPSLSKIAMVIVMVTMISHPLMVQARALAAQGARIVYLKSPSISAVRQTVESAAKPTATLATRPASATA